MDQATQVLVAQVDRLLARVDGLEREVTELRALNSPDQPVHPSDQTDTTDGAGRAEPRGGRALVGRRHAMRAGLAAAGAAVAGGAVLFDAQPAAAANGGSVTLGNEDN